LEVRLNKKKNEITTKAGEMPLVEYEVAIETILPPRLN